MKILHSSVLLNILNNQLPGKKKQKTKTWLLGLASYCGINIPIMASFKLHNVNVELGRDAYNQLLRALWVNCSIPLMLHVKICGMNESFT